MAIPLSSLFWRARGTPLEPVADFVNLDVRARERVCGFQTLTEKDGLSAGDPVCWVAEIEDGRVVAANKVVATATDAAIGGIQMLFRHSAKEQARATRRVRLRWPHRRSGVSAVIEGADSGNYYHWLFDGLPRLHLLELAGHSLGRLDALLLGEPRQDFRIQSLLLAGFDEKRIVFTSKNQVLHCDRLLVPSMPSRMGLATKWACSYLRERFLDKGRAAASRRIFVSRALAKGRRIRNEHELEPVLRRYGFEIVHAELLSFAEQISLFSSATMVIGVHGAGLSNVVWSEPGTKVLELRSPVHANECFSTIADHCGLDYATEVLALAYGSESGDRFANLVVEPASVERVIRGWVG